MDTEIIWQDPPAQARRGRAGGADRHVAEALRANPGRWAQIASASSAAGAHALAHNIKKAQRVAYRDGGYEAAARTVDGKHLVYARYVGADT